MICSMYMTVDMIVTPYRDACMQWANANYCYSSAQTTYVHKTICARFNWCHINPMTDGLAECVSNLKEGVLNLEKSVEMINATLQQQGNKPRLMAFSESVIINFGIVWSRGLNHHEEVITVTHNTNLFQTKSFRHRTWKFKIWKTDWNLWIWVVNTMLL